MSKRDASRREWLGHVRRFSRSGATRSAYCAAHGLSPHTFDYWRRQFGPDAQSGSARGSRKSTTAQRRSGKLVPVVVATQAPASRAQAVDSAVAVDLLISERLRLRIVPGTDAAWLAGVVRELLAC